MSDTSIVRNGLRWFGSLKLGVVTLALLAGILVVATAYESKTSTREVQEAVYLSGWFLALLGLLALNVLCAALVRYPWKARHLGFVLTHFGILTLLLGAIIGLAFGVEGTMTLVEGGPGQSSFRREFEVVQIVRRDTGQSVMAKLGTEHEPLLAGQTRRLRTAPLPLEARLAARHAHTREALEVREGGTATNPAVRVTWRGAMEGAPPAEGTEWLVAGDPQHQEWAIGPVGFRLQTVASPEILARRLQPPSPVRSNECGVLNVEVDQQLLRVPVLATGGEAQSPDGKIKVVIREYYATFQMDTQAKKPVSISDQPRNPAVLYEVTTPAGQITGFSFADFPDMVMMRKGTLPAGAVKARYEFDRTDWGITGGMDSALTVTILAGPGKQLHYQVSGAGATAPSGPLALGQRVVLPGKLSFEFGVAEWFDRPQVSTRWVPAPPEGEYTYPALEVQVGQGAQAQKLFLRWGRTEPVTLGGVAYDMTYCMAAVPLDFTVTLKKFSAPKYEGTTMPAGYESSVTVNDLKSGLTFDRTIWMNHPLHYGGYRLSQASYQEGTGGQANRSILQVLRDPGWPLKWAGSFLIMAGLTTMFYYRPRTATAPRPAEKA